MSDFPFESQLLNEDNVHLLENFSCGRFEIDRYIKEDAFRDNQVGNGVTYLILDRRNGKLVAYYTITSTSLLYFDNEDISNKQTIEELVIRGISSVELKMFAMSKVYQDVSYDDKYLVSDIVLGAVIGDIYHIATSILGAKKIILNSTPEAVKFYKRNNFLLLDEYIALYDEYTEDCIPMYITLFE